MADSTTNLDTLAPPPTANNELRANEIFDALSPSSLFGRRAATTTGLTWGFFGGRFGGTIVANGTVTLSNGTNRVVALRSTGVVSTSTATTNWNNTADYARLYTVVAASSVVTSYEDHRAGIYGPHWVPYGRRVNSQSAAYGFLITDQNTFVLHPSADTTARVFTIPANSGVPYPIGTELEIINQNSAGVVTIAITTDTMRLVGAGTTGSRTLAANGWARVKKLTATEWIIRGDGLT